MATSDKFPPQVPYSLEGDPNTSYLDLPNDKGTLVFDTADRPIIARLRWHASVQPHTTYAVGCTHDKRRYERRAHIEILGKAPPGYEIDHIDGDGLNNRRSDLRYVTRSQNVRNRRATGKSRYLGVSVHKATGKWQATVMQPGGKYKHLGYFNEEEAAARAYDAAARANGFHTTKFNFPDAA